MNEPNEKPEITSPAASVIVAIRQAYRTFKNKNGMDPTEIWLGPTEVIMFDGHINQMLTIPQMMAMEKAGKYEDAPNSNRGMIKDGACEYEGMKVRFMQARGVRVGVSFEPEPEPEKADGG